MRFCDHSVCYDISKLINWNKTPFSNFWEYMYVFELMPLSHAPLQNKNQYSSQISCKTSKNVHKMLKRSLRNYFVAKTVQLTSKHESMCLKLYTCIISIKIRLTLLQNQLLPQLNWIRAIPCNNTVNEEQNVFLKSSIQWMQWRCYGAFSSNSTLKSLSIHMASGRWCHAILFSGEYNGQPLAIYRASNLHVCVRPTKPVIGHGCPIDCHSVIMLLISAKRYGYVNAYSIVFVVGGVEQGTCSLNQWQTNASLLICLALWKRANGKRASIINLALSTM